MVQKLVSVTRWIDNYMHRSVLRLDLISRLVGIQCSVSGNQR